MRVPLPGADPLLPLTLLPGLDPGIRGSLPLTACGVRAGVRGSS
jgi:hypothetical protein